jgi:hypothetical protein
MLEGMEFVVVEEEEEDMGQVVFLKNTGESRIGDEPLTAQLTPRQSSTPLRFVEGGCGSGGG